MPYRHRLHRPPQRALRCLLVGLASLLSAGMSAGTVASAKDPAPPAAVEEFNDPLENVNRAIFRFNDGVVDRFVLTPVGTAYNAVLPDAVRTSLHNFLRNLRSPIIFANDVLQGDFKGAHQTLARFLMNSTLGIGGLVDLAGRAGIPYHYQDFGVTFGVWGIKPGPYLVLPVLGPSDPRDLVGNIAEGFADPGNIVAHAHEVDTAIYARGGASGVDTYARNMDALKTLKRTSIDYYAAIRSIYQQRRAAFIERKGGTSLPNPGLAATGGTVVASKPLPPPADAARFDPNRAQVAEGPSLYPPSPAADVPARKSRRVVEGAELFPPPGLVADDEDPGAPASR